MPKPTVKSEEQNRRGEIQTLDELDRQLERQGAIGTSSRPIADAPHRAPRVPPEIPRVTVEGGDAVSESKGPRAEGELQVPRGSRHVAEGSKTRAVSESPAPRPLGRPAGPRRNR